MNQDYSRYSRKTKRILKKADNFLYENSKHLGRVKNLVDKIDNIIILDEAELAANK